MHGKLITQHLLRYAHQSLDSASERIHVYAHQRWYTTVDACHIQTGSNQENAPIPNTHLATPTLHPTWFTRQVSLSYLQCGPVTSINSTPKSLSNSKTYTVTETYEACYPTRFEEQIPQLGFSLGKDPCHVMPISPCTFQPFVRRRHSKTNYHSCKSIFHYSFWNFRSKTKSGSRFLIFVLASKSNSRSWSSLSVLDSSAAKTKVEVDFHYSFTLQIKQQQLEFTIRFGTSAPKTKIESQSFIICVGTSTSKKKVQSRSCSEIEEPSQLLAIRLEPSPPNRNVKVEIALLHYSSFLETGLAGQAILSGRRNRLHLTIWVRSQRQIEWAWLGAEHYTTHYTTRATSLHNKCEWVEYHTHYVITLHMLL